MKIVFLDKSTLTLGDIDFSDLQAMPGYLSYDHSNEDEIIERAANADIVITNKAKMTKRIISNLSNLKLICVIATGYNNVDVLTARKKGVLVCNVAGYAARTVPQHTFSLILNLATQAHKYHQDVMSGEWQKASLFTLLHYPTFELAGKCIGIIGFGVIGRNVARIAEGFGMRVLVNDANMINDSNYRQVELEFLLCESDIITLHCPLTEQTRNLIDTETLGKMKPSALLINTARGGIVDEQALADALNNGTIGGAGFDVLTEEPPVNGNILMTAKNMIITPHSAWSTVEARQMLVNETIGNIQAFIQGNPRNVVS